MKFSRTEIADVIIIEPALFGDARGYFTETFRKDKLEDFLGVKINFCQENESKSGFGVLRGLHFQLPPFSQTKLVRVKEGKVLDVAVDIRIGSPTFGKYIAEELSAENRRQLFVPRGFAHGFVVLSEIAVFNYKVDNYYSPESDRGLAFNDPAIGIDWILSPDEMILSEKDKKQPLMQDNDSFYYSNDLYV
jgi:dTDP-4-dehydrorhamnose 3,5-epimerase